MSGASATGRAIGVVTPLALMLWAATEVGNPVLRVALLAWVVIVVALQAATAGGWTPKEWGEGR